MVKVADHHPIRSEGTRHLTAWVLIEIEEWIEHLICTSENSVSKKWVEEASVEVGSRASKEKEGENTDNVETRRKP